jgi:hypothetical protein
MFPNHLLYIDKGMHKSLGGLSCHLVEEKTNTKKQKLKMHIKLQCWMGWWSYKLNKARHTRHWHEKHIEYDGMRRVW